MKIMCRTASSCCAAPHADGAVLRGFATHRLAGWARHRQELVTPRDQLYCRFWPQCVGIDFRLGRHANGNSGESSVLLEGDAGKQVERRIVTLHHPAASWLKVGNDASANATTSELVA